MSERGPIDFVETLADWAEGRLSAGEIHDIERKLAESEEATRSDAKWLKAFFEVSTAVKLAGPPPETRELLKRRFESYAEEQKQHREPGLFRRLISTLSFDSGTMPAMAGTRSAATGETRQLVYTTEEADVAIDLRPAMRPSALDISGQVLPSSDVDSEEFTVQLLKDDREVRIAAADDLGEFTFEVVPAGKYELVLSAERFKISVGPVELEA
jgi:hypothetical protein